MKEQLKLKSSSQRETNRQILKRSLPGLTNIAANQKWLPLWLAAIIFLVPMVASANYMEIQLDGQRFSQFIGESMLAMGICPMDVGGSEFIVDHFHGSLIDDFLLRRGDTDQFRAQRGSLRSSRSIRVGDEEIFTAHVDIRVPMTVRAKTEACMDRSHCNDEHEDPVDLDLVLTITINGESLCLELYSIIVLPSEFEIPVGREIRNKTTACAPLNMGMFTSMLEGYDVIGRGITVSDDEQRFAIRFEYAPAEGDGSESVEMDVEMWRDFYDGRIAPSGDSSNLWSLFLHRDLLVESVVNRLIEGVQEQEDFRVRSASEGTWHPADGSATVGAHIEAEFGPCNIDISIDASVYSSLHVGDPEEYYPADGSLIDPEWYDLSGCPCDGALIVESSISSDVEKWKAMLCALGLTALFHVFTGWDFSINWFGHTLMFLGAIDTDSTDRDHCMAAGDSGLLCVYPISLPSLQVEDISDAPVADFSLGPLGATDDGLIFGGGLELLGGIESVERLSGTTEPFDFENRNQCCAGNFGEGFGLHGKLYLDGGTRWCGDEDGYEILDDDLDVYILEPTSGPGNFGNFNIVLDADADDVFWRRPYPFRAWVNTAGGKVLFELDPPGLSPDDWAGAGFECRMARELCDLRGGMDRDPHHYGRPPDEIGLDERICVGELVQTMNLDMTMEVASTNKEIPSAIIKNSAVIDETADSHDMVQQAVEAETAVDAEIRTDEAEVKCNP